MHADSHDAPRVEKLLKERSASRISIQLPLYYKKTIKRGCYSSKPISDFSEF